MEHVQVKGQKSLNGNKSYVILFWKSADVW